MGIPKPRFGPTPQGLKIAGALLLAAFTMAGCSRAVNRAAERRIRDAMPAMLGPARAYHAHVDSSAAQTAGGRMAHVLIDGDDVRIENGMVIDHLHLDLRDVSVDTARGTVRSVGSAAFTATIGEASLDEFLAGEAPEDAAVRSIRITLRPGNIVYLAAERTVMGVRFPFSVTGPVRVSGPKRIEIDTSRMTILGIPLTGKPLQFLKRRFESAADLSTFPFPVTLQSVNTGEGTLTLAGTADAAALLQRASEQK